MKSTYGIKSSKLECESFSQLYFLVVIDCWFKFPKCLLLLPACSKRSRKRLRADLLSLPAVVSSLACFSRAYFSRYPQNGEIARRLTLRLGTSLLLKGERTTTKAFSINKTCFSSQFCDNENDATEGNCYLT